MDISSITNHKKIDITYSDHSAIYIDIQARKQKVKNQQRISRDMRKLRSNPDRYRQELAKGNWAFDNLDVDQMVDHWNSENQKVLDKLAKKKARNLAKRKKVQFPPEVNEKLKKLK